MSNVSTPEPKLITISREMLAAAEGMKLRQITYDSAYLQLVAAQDELKKAEKRFALLQEKHNEEVVRMSGGGR